MFAATSSVARPDTAVQTAATLTKCSHIIIPAVTTGVSHTHNHVKSQTGCFCKNLSATVPDKAGLICIVSMSAGADKTSVNTVIYIYARVYKYSRAQYCEKDSYLLVPQCIRLLH